MRFKSYLQEIAGRGLALEEFAEETRFFWIILVSLATL
jgi:hypothetical protein